MSRRKSSKGQRNFVPPPVDTEYFEDQRYILYVRSGQKASAEAKKIAAPILQYQVQLVDVQDLDRTQRPDWLRGTPTLVDVNKKRAYMGTAVLETLEDVINTDDGTGPRTACKPSGWLNNCARFEMDIDDDPQDRDAFLKEHRGVSDHEITRYQKLRKEQLGEPPANANQPLGTIDALEDDLADYYDDNMDRKLTNQDMRSYLERRSNMPRRRGPPSARSAGMAINDTRRGSVTEQKMQRYLQRRQQVPERVRQQATKRSTGYPQRQRPKTKRRRL